MKKKRDRKKSERPIPEEKQNLLKTFLPNEIVAINQLVSDLYKIRKVEPPTVRHFWQKKKAVKEQMDMVLEQEFYYVGDFLIENGWVNDREKSTALWEYLQLEFK